MIIVCPLSKVETTVNRVGAERLLSLLAAGTDMVRPAAIRPKTICILSCMTSPRLRRA